jgi:hypothetical protein
LSHFFSNMGHRMSYERWYAKVARTMKGSPVMVMTGYYRWERVKEVRATDTSSSVTSERGCNG